MEAGKMAWMLGIAVMAFLSCLQLAASARDPQLGRLHLQGVAPGGGRLRQQLVCCNRCRPGWDGQRFVCEDRTEMQLGCNLGCRNCRCDPTRYPSCQCHDQLFRCPRPCDAAAHNDGGAVAAGTAERLRA